MKDKSLRVLFVEDSENDLLFINRELKKGGYNPVYKRVYTASAMEKALKDEIWDIILCDYKMPNFSAPAAIALLKETNLNIPLIVVSGTIGEETAIECMLLGAQDYIMKSNLSRLCPAIAREIEETTVRNKRKQAEEALKESEENFHRSLEESPLGIRITNVNTDTIYANRSILDIYGYDSMEEMNKTPLKERYTPESYAAFEIRNEKRKRGEPGPSEYEISIVNKKGEIRHLQVFRKQIFWNGTKQFQAIYHDITERKRTEEELRKEKMFNQTIIQSSPTFFVAINSNGETILMNDTLLSALGYTRNEVEGMNYLATFVPEIDREDLSKVFEQLIQIKKSTINVNHILDKDGRQLLVEWHGQPVFKEAGKLDYFFGVGVNITERKKAEEDLKQSEAKFRAIFESFEDLYYQTDLNGIITVISPSAYSLSGWKPEELIGQSATIVYDLPESREALIKKIKELGHVRDYELNLIKRDGSRRMASLAGHLLYDSSGAVTGIAGSLRDISERKQAEDALKANEEKYRLVVDNAIEAILIVQEGRFKFVNPRTIELLGCPEEVLMSKPFTEFIHPDDRKLVMERHIKRMSGEAIPDIYSFRAVTADGTIRWVEIHAVMITWEDKPATLNFIDDITERRIAEASLKESEERFRLVAKSTSDLIYERDLITGIATYFGDMDAFHGYEPGGFPRSLEGFIEHLHPDDVIKAGEALQLANEQNRPYNVIHRLRCKDGSYVTWWDQATIIKDDRGFPIKLVGAATDITKLKKAQEGREQAENKYQSLFENAQEGIYQSTPEGRYIIANQSMARILGYDSPEDLISVITDITRQVYVDPEDRSKIMEIIEQQGSVRNQEVQFYRKDGSIIWISRTMQVIRDEKGKILHYEGIIEDITDRKKNVERLRNALGGTVRAIAFMVETRDPYTAGHQQRVADLARTIATEMGLSNDRVEGLRVAAVIHDIGKISVPAEILSKPSKLTDIEFSLIKIHAQSGYDILKDIEFPWPIARIVIEHHERINGSGYPNGLTGNNLLLESRILSVADVVEAMASHRPYRPSLGIEPALEEIEKNKGILYDEAVANACLRLFREKNYQLQ